MTTQDRNQGNGDAAEIDETAIPRALIYLRVSTKEQAEMGGEAEGFSIPAQRAACTRKAEALGAVVEEEFVDRGESAKTANRPELARMLRFLGESPVQYVIVHKVDRLARNRADDVAITMEIKKCGAALVSCSENIDETPSGLLLHGIMSSIAEFYSRNLANEVTKGLQQKVKTGGTVHRAPTGYINVRRLENGREVRSIELDPERAPLVQWAFEAYATGEWTLSRLLEELTSRGLTTRPGPHTPARTLSLSGLHYLLKNPYFIGLVVYRGAYHPGKHEPLVSFELFDRVRATLEAHNQAGERQYRHNHYLKGSVFCGICGRRLAVEYSRGRNGTLYDYFFCLGRQTDASSCTFRATRVADIEQRIADHYRQVQLPGKRIEIIAADLADALSARRAEAEAAEQLQTLRISRLSDQREKLLQLHYAEAIPIDLFKKDQERIMRELQDARSQLAAVAFSFDAIERNLHRALELAKNCHAAYQDANGTMRRLFNQAFFDRLVIDQDGEVTHDYAEPFKLLLDPELCEKLRDDKDRTAKPSVEWDESREVENDEGLTLGEAFGSNFAVMVGDVGFEPTTPCL